MSGILKLSDKPVVQIAAYHEALYKDIDAYRKAGERMLKRLTALIASKYEKRFPTVDEYDNDQSALKAISERQGREPSFFRKQYAAAINEVYGALPVSMSDEATRARQAAFEKLPADTQKKALDIQEKAIKEGLSQAQAVALAQKTTRATATKKVQSKPGAPEGAANHNKGVSDAEMMEQFIARFGKPGIFIALDAVVAILASEQATKSKADSINKLRNQLARELKAHQTNAA